MIDKKLIDRINELARKSRVSPLSEEELAEQKELRQKYIASFHANLESQLRNIDIKNPDGSIEHVADRVKK